MKFREWLEELEYDVISGNLDIEVEDVIYDSRKAREHVVFVCTKGTKVDSHEFIPDVLRAGCKVLVVEKEVEVPADVPAESIPSFVTGENGGPGVSAPQQEPSPSPGGPGA